MSIRGALVSVGPSRLDGGPILLALTLASQNRKIGDMAQAWVLRADVPPRDALEQGLDRSICGDCVHRSGGVAGRSCYVSTQLGPTTIWQAAKAGAYAHLDAAAAAALLAGQQLRVTAYGDPAALPFALWQTLLRHVAGFTCYTHQWRTCDQRFQRIAMASVESDGEVEQAHALGWRTFRTRLETERVRPDEIVCPASDEAGHQVTCEECGLCVGASRAAARSIAIIAHGQRTKWFTDRKELVNA